jgi:hypothetical protein
VQRWAMDKQRAGRELSFPELLRDLVFILPSDLLLLLYESSQRAVLDTLQEFSVNSPPTEVSNTHRLALMFACLYRRSSLRVVVTLGSRQPTFHR